MLDRTALPTDRLAAIEFYENWLTSLAKKSPDHLREAKRWLCRNDLFYLLVAVLGRKDANRDWIFDRCREVEREPNGFLDLWSREHYKSTIITFALSLQDILASHGEDPEPRYAGIEVTIGFFSHTRPIAKDFLKQIKREAETNKVLLDLFPDVLWARPTVEAPKWSEDEGLIFRRSSNPRESTVEAHGLVDGQPIGKHFWILMFDDVVTEDSVTPAMIEKTTKAWELATNLGTEGGIERYAGTRYAAFDTYHEIMQRGVPARIHACTSDGTEDFSKAVLMSPAELAKRRRKQGIYTFGAQMLLDPTADKKQGFLTEWLQFWDCASFANLNFYIVVDPASKKKPENDWTCMWVIGVNALGDWMICDVVHDRLSLTERADYIIGLHRDWSEKGPVLGVGWESYGMMADIEHIEYRQKQENYLFDITELGGSLHKHDRIRTLVPKFETGQIYLPHYGTVYRTNHEGHRIDLIHRFVHEQYKVFPVSKWFDMLDALARMSDMDVILPKPVVAVASTRRHVVTRPSKPIWTR